MRIRSRVFAITFSAAAAMGGWQAGHLLAQNSAAPKFEVDRMWPKPLPNHWILGSITGLAVQGNLVYEGPRYVLPDDSSRIPGWTTLGLATRYSSRAFGSEWLLRAGVDNLFDRRAWKESPYQFSHAYLYPLEPRTFRASIQVTL